MHQLVYHLKNIPVSGFIGVGLLLGILVFISIFNQDTQVTDTRLVRYSFTVQNTNNSLLKNADLWVYAPAKRTSFQETTHIDANYPFELQQDTVGNQVLHFKLADLPPYGSKIITISATVDLYSTPRNISVENTARYTQGEKYIEVNDPLIQQQASFLRGKNTEQTLLKTYTWVSQSIQYAGYIKDDRGALYAMKHKAGDCTEYMYLFSALARANHIPTRSVGGYIVKQNSILSAREYHNWAEVYLDGAWRVVDAQNKKLTSQEQDYIVFRIIQRENIPALANTHRFAYTGKGLRVEAH